MSDPRRPPWWRRARVAGAAVGLIVALSSACSSTATTAPGHGDDAVADADADRWRVEVIAEHPHDQDAFTQGLELHGSILYESSGGRGASWVRATDLGTGEVLARYDLAEDLFAEGLTRVGDRLVVLTWTSGVALVLDATSLEERERWSYQGQGWGLCFDGEHLIASDGSDTLTRRDPDDFTVEATVRVRAGERPIDRLNELECVEDRVLANVFGREEIVRIDPGTGQVTGVIDARGLMPDHAEDDADAVLNGIAHEPDHDTYWLTGKRWGIRYHVRLVPDDDPPAGPDPRQEP